MQDNKERGREISFFIACSVKDLKFLLHSSNVRDSLLYYSSLRTISIFILVRFRYTGFRASDSVHSPLSSLHLHSHTSTQTHAHTHKGFIQVEASCPLEFWKSIYRVSYRIFSWGGGGGEVSAHKHMDFFFGSSSVSWLLWEGSNSAWKKCRIQLWNNYVW